MDLYTSRRDIYFGLATGKSITALVTALPLVVLLSVSLPLLVRLPSPSFAPGPSLLRSSHRKEGGRGRGIGGKGEGGREGRERRRDPQPPIPPIGPSLPPHTILYILIMIVIPRTSAILYVSSNSFSVMQMMWLLCKGLEPSLFFHFSFARCLVADVSSVVPHPESHLTTSQVLRTSYMHPQFSYKMCSERDCVRVCLSIFFFFFFESSQRNDSDRKKRERKLGCFGRVLLEFIKLVIQQMQEFF